MVKSSIVEEPMRHALLVVRSYRLSKLAFRYISRGSPPYAISQIFTCIIFTCISHGLLWCGHSCHYTRLLCTRVPIHSCPLSDSSQRWHRADSAGQNNTTFRLARNRDDCTRRSAVSSNLHSVTIIQTDRRPDRILYGIGAVASQANFQIRFYRKRDFARKVCTLRFRLIPT